MSKKKNTRQPASQAATVDESPEQRRARQIKEWEERKKQKERRKSSGSPLAWVASVAGVAVLGVLGAVMLLLQGGSSDGSPAATPVLDARVAGLPVAQEVEIVADDQGQANNPTFDPTFVSGSAGDVIEFTLVNQGSVAHNLTVSGTDKEYGTPDDFTMDALNAGEEGTLRVKIDEPGTYPFRCDLHPLQQVGNLALG